MSLPRIPTTLASWGLALLSPTALFRLPRAGWSWLGAYLGAGGLLLGAVTFALHRHQDDLTGLLYSYLFPVDWHGGVDLLREHFFLAQQRVVLINAVITASLLAVTVLLFPLKEWLSASFERHAGLVPEPVHEHPLLVQGWQELQLFLLYLAVQGTIFVLGYPPVPALKLAAAGLGYLFLFFTFAVDFISPLLQRHQGRYSQIIKLLARHPLAALTFGALFSLPPLAIGALWEANPGWSWPLALGLLFGVNLLSIAWAAVAGTWLAARLLPALPLTRRPGPKTRTLAWLGLLGLLGANVYLYGHLLISAHHKSQVLKCNYSVDLGSFRLGRPDLGDLLADEVAVDLGFAVEIENPTRFDLDIEDSELEVAHQGRVVARTRLARVAVPAHQTRAQEVDLELRVDPGAVAFDSALIDPKRWQITLYLDVAPYLRIPVYLLHPGAR
ncbi:LEA type 2 family protein [Haliangium sp.]|uniref:NDR1/HIN1-like protein n=1 Tax=Haliangium sp. TaxID=2663208 RepID=UPI003D0EB310